jgi:hypothetical protein
VKSGQQPIAAAADVASGADGAACPSGNRYTVALVEFDVPIPKLGAWPDAIERFIVGFVRSREQAYV